MLQRAYSLIGVVPQEHPVLLTDAPFNPQSNKERLAEYLFETCGAPGLFTAIPAVLALQSNGAQTGVVLDVGEGVAHCAALYDGNSLEQSIQRVDLGGLDVTEFLQLLLRRSGHMFYTSSEVQTVRKIKEST